MSPLEIITFLNLILGPPSSLSICGTHAAPDNFAVIPDISWYQFGRVLVSKLQRYEDSLYSSISLCLENKESEINCNLSYLSLLFLSPINFSLAISRGQIAAEIKPTIGAA